MIGIGHVAQIGGASSVSPNARPLLRMQVWAEINPADHAQVSTPQGLRAGSLISGPRPPVGGMTIIGRRCPRSCNQHQISGRLRLRKHSTSRRITANVIYNALGCVQNQGACVQSGADAGGVEPTPPRGGSARVDVMCYRVKDNEPRRTPDGVGVAV